MKASWLVALAAGATLTLAAPPEVEAQSRSQREAARQQQERREAERERLRRQREREQRAGGIWQDARDWERDRRRDSRSDDDDDDNRNRRRNGDWGYDDDDDDDDNRRRRDVYARNGRGPAFCRSGEGHPVYGRQWCRDRGYGLGNERSRDVWGDIIFRQPRDRRYENRTLNRSVLGDILGNVVLGRFESYGRQYRTGSGSLTGRWLPDSRSNVLQLYMGSTPIARLVDTNRDGRVDSVQLR